MLDPDERELEEPERTVPWNELRDAQEETERLFEIIRCRSEAVAWVLDLLDALHVPRPPDSHDSLEDVVLFRLLNLAVPDEKGRDKTGCDKTVIDWVRGMDLKLEVVDRSSVVYGRWAGYSDTEGETR